MAKEKTELETILENVVEQALKEERARLADIIENMWPPREGEFAKFLEELAKRIKES